MSLEQLLTPVTILNFLESASSITRGLTTTEPVIKFSYHFEWESLSHYIEPSKVYTLAEELATRLLSEPVESRLQLTQRQTDCMVAFIKQYEKKHHDQTDDTFD